MDAHLESLRLRGYSATTIYARRRLLLRLRAVLPVPLLEASPEMLAGWRAGLAVTDDVVVSYVSHIREFYGWAERQALISGSPAAGLPAPRMGRRLPRPVSEEDLMLALAAASARVRPWLVLAAWCGLRAKEIALLRRDSILETARPPVLLVAADATKGRNERMVPLSSFVLAELAAAALPPGGFAFRRLDGRPGPNQPWLISHYCNAHLHACGVAATLHQLRHRFGTMTYRACRDLRTVQELLGHSSPSTTAGYAAYDHARAVDAVEALPVPVPRLRITGQ